MPVHPDIQRVLDARSSVRLSTLPVDEARAGHYKGATAGPPGPEMAEVTDQQIEGVPVRSYRPNDHTGSGVVYFHGGGWVLGSIETHDRQCRNLAAGSGATVFSVDYRLAPEHTFPAAYDDALAVTGAILAGAGTPTIDTSRVALAGDSAGGNLAAAVAITCRDLGGPAPLAQLLVYPALDATMSTPSYDENADGPFLSPVEMAWFYRLYGADHPTDDPRLSPLAATDLAGLPPALVITAELDPLRDEGETYAARLAAAGTPAGAARYAGVCHGFFGWSHLAEPSRLAMAQCAGWLRAQLEADR